MVIFLVSSNGKFVAFIFSTKKKEKFEEIKFLVKGYSGTLARNLQVLCERRDVW